MVFKNGLKNIQAKGYNEAFTIFTFNLKCYITGQSVTAKIFNDPYLFYCCNQPDDYQ